MEERILSCCNDEQCRPWQKCCQLTSPSTCQCTIGCCLARPGLLLDTRTHCLGDVGARVSECGCPVQQLSVSSAQWTVKVTLSSQTNHNIIASEEKGDPVQTDDEMMKCMLNLSQWWILHFAKQSQWLVLLFMSLSLFDEQEICAYCIHSMNFISQQATAFKLRMIFNVAGNPLNWIMIMRCGNRWLMMDCWLIGTNSYHII